MSVIESNVATSRFPFFTATPSKVTIIQEELDSSKKFKLDDINSVAVTKVDYFSDKDKSNYSMNTRLSSDATTVLSQKAENIETNTVREYPHLAEKTSYKMSWKAIEDIHNNNKHKMEKEHSNSSPAKTSNDLNMTSAYGHEKNESRKIEDKIQRKSSPSTSSSPCSSPVTRFPVTSSSVMPHGAILKPLGLRIPHFPHHSPPTPNLPIFPHHVQRPTFLPWLYNNHIPSTIPLIGDTNLNATVPAIASSAGVTGAERNLVGGASQFLPPPFPTLMSPALMSLSMPTPSSVDLSNVFPPGMPLGRGHELMRRLCAMNPQFASSVLEDYIRPQVRDGDIVLEIECGPNAALLYLSRLCQGSKGPCIWFQDSWLTPNEFQYISGRETAKDWKRSIRHCGKSMKLLLTKGILTTHPPICDCDGCRISSPVVSFPIYCHL